MTLYEITISCCYDTSIRCIPISPISKITNIRLATIYSDDDAITNVIEQIT